MEGQLVKMQVQKMPACLLQVLQCHLCIFLHSWSGIIQEMSKNSMVDEGRAMCITQNVPKTNDSFWFPGIECQVVCCIPHIQVVNRHPVGFLVSSSDQA